MASGSTRMPKRVAASAVWRRASSRSSRRPVALPRARFSATVIGPTNAKCCVTIPIPAAIASRGDRTFSRPSADEDLAAVGLGQPVGNPHDGRLAGAVLAEQRVNLAVADIEIDGVVGDEVTESLGDPAKLQGR